MLARPLAAPCPLCYALRFSTVILVVAALASFSDERNTF